MEDTYIRLLKKTTIDFIETCYDEESTGIQIIINVHPEKNRVQISITESLKERTVINKQYEEEKYSRRTVHGAGKRTDAAGY